VPRFKIQKEFAQASSARFLRWSLHIVCENALRQSRLPLLEQFQIQIKVYGCRNSIRRFRLPNRIGLWLGRALFAIGRLPRFVRRVEVAAAILRRIY
jgi:hypothetical protein